MKNLYIIGGVMGVGKTTVCNLLNKKLSNSVFLDGDWCWNMNPFIVNDETKKMVVDNICFMLNNFIKCTLYENIVFCWVMHQQDIIDNIISRLDTSDINLVCISLIVTENELKKRLQKDIECGLRSVDLIEISKERLKDYKKLNTIKINTDNMSAEEIAQKIMDIRID